MIDNHKQKPKRLTSESGITTYLSKLVDTFYNTGSKASATKVKRGNINSFKN